MTQNIKNKDLTVSLISLGCPKNLVDSEVMLARLGSAGFVITASAENADIAIINTCGFIAPAKQEACDHIGDILKLKAKGSIKAVIVTGCLAQRSGPELAQRFPEIDAIVGLDMRDDIACIIERVLSGDPADKDAAALDNCFTPVTQPRRRDVKVPDDSERLLVTPPHWAYLRISEGCDRHCSFCTIPAIRGPFRSKQPDEVFAEAESLVASGTREIIVIAQDTTNYGRDLGLKNGLASLIKRFEGIDGLDWLRIMYMYPAGIDDELIETIANSEKCVNYIDMPIQHASDSVLEAMKRPERRADLKRLIEKLRTEIPAVVLRSTVIAGFPGESQEDFETLMDFVKWARFDALGCFTYYPEQGTESADFDNQLPEELKNDRAEQVMLAQQQIAFENNEKLLGKEFQCVIDHVTPGKGHKRIGTARYYGQAPEIDSVCIVKKCRSDVGDVIRVRVSGYENYDILSKEI